MNKENITKTLEILLGKSRWGAKHEYKQRTAYGTYDILTTKVDKGSTRLNSGVLRNQISVFLDKKTWDESTDEGKRIFYKDQYIFVQVDDDVWDVYQGGGKDGPTLLENNVKGFKDVLKNQISKIDPGLLLKKEELIREKSAATFLVKAMKFTQKEDSNLTHIENLNKYTVNDKTLSIDGYAIGVKKDRVTRDSDVDDTVQWNYNDVGSILS